MSPRRNGPSRTPLGEPGSGRGSGRISLLVVGILGLLGACGRVGPPVPPEDRLPRPVADLRAVVEEGAIRLTWTNPDRRVDNTRLRDLAEARVYRAEDAGEGEPRAALLWRGRVPGYTLVATLRPGADGAGGAGAAVSTADTQGLVLGRRYTYVVVTADPLGRLSAPSPRVSVQYLAPPEPPQGLVAEAGEGEVRLRWTPPERFVDGSPLVGALVYEVLRALEPEPPGVVVGPPVAEPHYLDRAVENDRTYHYAVRALRREADTVARGRPSAPVAATPRDLTPPTPPGDLVAVPAADGVHLAWRPSPEPDVAAYAVYRAAGSGPRVRVGSVGAPTTVFVDRGLPPGTYRYVVTALDRAARPNESGPSNEVTVVLP